MRWTLKAQPQAEQAKPLVESLGVSTLLANILVQRGITSFDAAKLFFRPSLDQLHDPFLMTDMEKAVNRIVTAIQNNAPILVYGDYDVDGTCSVAMMASFLDTIGAQVATYIPDRYAEGYGVSTQGIDYAADNAIDLIIALDCGVKAISQVAYAKTKQVDFIICDHHRPGSELPNAVAILDPKREDCNYPFKELCGCGVGFKLIQALTQQLELPQQSWLPYLDLVATAIGADIVPIVGENRTLAYFGLQVINTSARPGFKAMFGARTKQKQTITDLVFGVAPRINAAGRMKHGDYAVALLLAQDIDQANSMAKEIEEFNTNRRATDRQITQEALAQIKELGEQESNATVVYHPSWHKGVIGIVASRLIETYYRPTVVFTKSGDTLAASVRSISGFDVYKALEACKEHIIQFGGHKYAAGLTLNQESYNDFKAAFIAQVTATITTAQQEPEIQIDAAIRLEDITAKFYRLLKQLAPFGPENRTPVFLARAVQGSAKCVGADLSHLKVNVKQGSASYSGIGFGLGAKKELLDHNALVDIAFSLDENHWQGNTTLQLRIKDIKPHV